MAVPTYDQLMLPLLQLASDEHIHSVREAHDAIAEYLNLSEEQINELTPGGNKTRYYDRINWAKTHLSKAVLLENTGRGLFKITERGLMVIQSKPERISAKYLKQFPEYVAFVTPSRTDTTAKSEPVEQPDEQTPEELIESTYDQLRKNLSDELLEVVLSVSPAFFEQLVIDLLLAMGYGSSLDAGKRIGQSGDGGVDGIIREDKLGLDMIYVQAKRWSKGNTVGRPEIQAFLGSLMGRGATKGVFITTSHFTEHAIHFAASIQTHKIILLNGEQLTTLMIEHNVGVSIQKTYVVKQIDENYFPDM